MTISMYQASVPVFIKLSTNLHDILKKGEAFAKERGFEEKHLLNGRLAADMFPLSRQIRIACDVSRRCIERLAGDELASFEDNEENFAEFYERINNNINYFQSIKPEQIDGTEEKEITIKIRQEEVNFSGMGLLINFSTPNFYFHVTTAYDILRHNGVELGKQDFLGKLLG